MVVAQQFIPVEVGKLHFSKLIKCSGKAVALGSLFQHHPIRSWGQSFLVSFCRGLTLPPLDNIQHQDEETAPRRCKERGRTEGTGTCRICCCQSGVSAGCSLCASGTFRDFMRCVIVCVLLMLWMSIGSIVLPTNVCYYHTWRMLQRRSLHITMSRTPCQLIRFSDDRFDLPA